MENSQARERLASQRSLLLGGGFLSLVLFVGVCFLLPGAIVRQGDPRLYVLASLVGMIDLADIVARVLVRRRHTKLPWMDHAAPTSIPLEIGEFTPRQMRLHVRPYAIVASVHNAEEELDDFLEAIRPYRDHLWVIDDASSDETFRLLQHAGVNCRRTAVNRKKPGALRELIASLPPDIATVVVLDPDSRIRDTGSSSISDLERVIFQFQRSRMAAVCPRIAIREGGLLPLFQERSADRASLGRLRDGLLILELSP